jgi:C1q domain
MKPLIFLVATFLIMNCCFSQVAINTDGSLPNSSSMLDVKSSNKGVLISRMDSSSRKAIAGPADGLMVFDTDTKSFWFFSGSWNEITGTNKNVGFAVTVKTSVTTSPSPVLFDSVLYNYGNGYIYSAPFLSYFQVPYNGFYHFDVVATMNFNSLGPAYQLSLYKTTGGINSRPLTTPFFPVSLQETHGYSTNLFLQKNDIITLWIEGVSVNVLGPDKTIFSGYKIF